MDNMEKNKGIPMEELDDDMLDQVTGGVEIGDTVEIDDIYGNRENAVITGLEISYDGTLSAVTKGVGA